VIVKRSKGSSKKKVLLKLKVKERKMEDMKRKTKVTKEDLEPINPVKKFKRWKQLHPVRKRDEPIKEQGHNKEDDVESKDDSFVIDLATVKPLMLNGIVWKFLETEEFNDQESGFEMVWKFRETEEFDEQESGFDGDESVDKIQMDDEDTVEEEWLDFDEYEDEASVENVSENVSEEPIKVSEEPMKKFGLMTNFWMTNLRNVTRNKTQVTTCNQIEFKENPVDEIVETPKTGLEAGESIKQVEDTKNLQVRRTSTW
jgi:hypothetical protein